VSRRGHNPGVTHHQPDPAPGAEPERGFLVAVLAQGVDEQDELAEMRELLRTAGVEPVGELLQRRPAPDPRTYVGKGKLIELKQAVAGSDAESLVVDDDLDPGQQRRLEDELKLRVVDRTQLILDIFAQRASTRDGKLQVELAQLQYRLPRLAQRDPSLSRLGGGIGGRGPGETQLEIDRRRVRERITRLARDLRQLELQRAHRRARRSRRGMPVLSIVGYTNAGKSTLLRALTRTEAIVEDKLFATLDPASRRLRFPRDREAIVTDTVGFIRDLPPQLVAAFRATLEELREADVFLHVVDASGEVDRRIAAVRGVLSDMGLGGVPELLVFNKIDRLPPGEGARLAREYGAVPVSAQAAIGLGPLLERVDELLFESGRPLPLAAEPRDAVHAIGRG
jgi:GTP-binding protein HflX